MWSGTSWEYFTASDCGERWGSEDLEGLGGTGDGLLIGDGLLRLLLM